MSRASIAVIVGATATGKSALAVNVAKRFDSARIISADSVMIYRGLDIGSAKPRPDEMMGIPHYMMDILEPEQGDFSVARYRDMATACIREGIERHEAPIVVGGTGLYISSLTYPLTFQSAPPNLELREQLLKAEEENKGSLHNMLRELNPKAADKLHPNDAKRLVRAIEIAKHAIATGQEIEDDFLNLKGRETEFSPIIVGIRMERAKLYDRINARVEAMIDAGFEGEVRGLLKSGVDYEASSMNSLGYRQMVAYIHGRTSLEVAKDRIKQETRRFAKRQETWLKRDERINWLCPDDFASLDDMAQRTYEIFKEGGL